MPFVCRAARPVAICDNGAGGGSRIYSPGLLAEPGSGSDCREWTSPAELHVRLWHAVAVLTVCSGLVEGCNSMIVEHVATPARDARAKQVLRSLASGERDALLANARFGDDSAAAQKGLAQLDSIFRGLHLDSMQLIGANEFSTPRMDRVTLSYEVHSERGWLVANVTTVESDGTPALIGLHAEPLVGELRK